MLERGAVEGEVFHRLGIKALAGERLAARWSAPGWACAQGADPPAPANARGDDAFRFRHLLIRDAAYDGLPKATRAELHERFARWLEEAAATCSSSMRSPAGIWSGLCAIARSSAWKSIRG